MTTEISVVESTALVSHRAATNAAGLCRELVVKTAMKIQGRRYVQVEGWQAIANAFGCVASARNVERVEDGYRAIGQVVRVSDGKVLAEAEGFVGDDESTWSKRPIFARRAMAQTRAMSRACRSAFAFVVTLMDAGLETTPAEEMTHVDVAHSPSRGFWLERVDKATTVEQLGAIGDDADEAVSTGELSTTQRKRLDLQIAIRHQQIDGHRTEVANGVA